MKPSVIIILMIMALSGSGCSTICQRMYGQEKEIQEIQEIRYEVAPASAKFVEAQELIKAHKFTEAITKYRLVIKEQPDTEWSPEAKYNIALAYVSSENPQRDYALGIAELDEFLVLYPQDPRAEEAKSWRMALKAVLDTKKENDRLHKNIEKLKQLDVQQEEKRLGK
jgi:outer membrane protein assembly factor BamD (BamD/ComL family)